MKQTEYVDYESSFYEIDRINKFIVFKKYSSCNYPGVKFYFENRNIFE